MNEILIHGEAKESYRSPKMYGGSLEYWRKVIGLFEIFLIQGQFKLKYGIAIARLNHKKWYLIMTTDTTPKTYDNAAPLILVIPEAFLNWKNQV